MTRAPRTARRPRTLRVALVHKMPTPYRVPVFDRIAERDGIDLTVVYSSEREPNRHWTLPEGRARSMYLRERIINLGENKYVHVNWGVWSALRRIRPHVVVTNGYNVTDLLAIAYAVTHGARVVCQIDGTVESERALTVVHRLVRRLADRFTDAYAGPSRSSLRLFRGFGAAADAVFWSPLAVDNSRFASPAHDERPIDLLFSGRLTEVKNPLFAIEVAGRAAARLDRPLRMLIAGSGELESAARSTADRYPLLEVEFAGFLQQTDLPAAYSSARLFLFPSSWDPWGLVANEAAAAGTPVIITPFAGAAGELIRDGEDGAVLDLDLDLWVARTVEVLEDPDAWRRMSASARAHVRTYTWDAAADGFVDAIEHAARAAWVRS